MRMLIFLEEDLGVVWVDLIADHLALAETDRFGNFVDSFILPFDFKDLRTTQTEALIGDLSAVLAEHCQSKGKALVIEELDFEEKKKALREEPKDRRSFLSAFAYAQFHKSIASRMRADGIELIPINPAYTSLIGAYIGSDSLQHGMLISHAGDGSVSLKSHRIKILVQGEVQGTAVSIGK